MLKAIMSEGVSTLAVVRMESCLPNAQARRARVRLPPGEGVTVLSTKSPRTTETFLTHREEIFAAFGSHLWPDEEEAVRRKRMKATTNAYDMDAGAHAPARPVQG